MSSTDLPPTEAAAAPYREGFDPRYEGRRAECDGGQPLAGTHLSGRQEFTGTLTGNYRDFGDYPWRWFLLTELTRKPHAFPHAAVWCAQESLTLLDGPPPNTIQGA
ncbi:MAG: hypothetical protein WCI19_12875 [Betaproteobacteria bacterium]|nr:hypothetical protein [Rhodocyclales bacterium]